jgi:hypothetical protein
MDLSQHTPPSGFMRSIINQESESAGTRSNHLKPSQHQEVLPMGSTPPSPLLQVLNSSTNTFPTVPDPAEPLKFLHDLQLAQYTHLYQAQGIKTVEQASVLTNMELKQLGITDPDHRYKILQYHHGAAKLVASVLQPKSPSREDAEGASLENLVHRQENIFSCQQSVAPREVGPQSLQVIDQMVTPNVDKHELITAMKNRKRMTMMPLHPQPNT